MFRTIVRRSSNGKILWTNEISVSIPYRAVDGRKIVENEIQSVLFVDRRSKLFAIPLLFLSYKSSKTPKFSWGFAPNPANALCVAFGDAPSALGASPQTPQKYSKKHWIFSIFVKNRYPTIGIFLSRGIGKEVKTRTVRSRLNCEDTQKANYCKQVVKKGQCGSSKGENME